MDKKKIEKAGQFISYGLRALINDDKEEEQDHLSYLQLDDLHKPDTFIVVRQYERNYRIEEQVKVNEFLEVDSFDDYEIYYEIYKHDDALVGKAKAKNGETATDSRTPKAILNYQAIIPTLALSIRITRQATIAQNVASHTVRTTSCAMHAA